MPIVAHASDNNTAAKAEASFEESDPRDWRHPVARRAGLRAAPHPLSGIAKNTRAARRHCGRYQSGAAGGLVRGAPTGNNVDVALCGAGACGISPR